MNHMTKEEMIRLGNMDVEGWVPKVGDQIYGTVVNRTTRTDEFENQPEPVVSIVTELDTGEPKLTSVAWFGILDGHAKQHDPQPGDIVFIKRLADVQRKGDVPKGQEAKYKNFRVLVHKTLA